MYCEDLLSPYKGPQEKARGNKMCLNRRSEETKTERNLLQRRNRRLPKCNYLRTWREKESMSEEQLVDRIIQ